MNGLAKREGGGGYLMYIFLCLHWDKVYLVSDLIRSTHEYYFSFPTLVNQIIDSEALVNSFYNDTVFYYDVTQNIQIPNIIYFNPQFAHSSL